MFALSVSRLSALLISLSAVAAQPPQWFYTGNARNDQLSATSFTGSSFNIAYEFFRKQVVEDGMEPPTFLYFGGTAAAFVSVNETVDENTLNFIQTQQQLNQTNIFVDYGVYHDLFSIIDYGADNSSSVHERLFSVEVGLYDFRTEIFSKQYWMKKKFGTLVAVVFSTVDDAGVKREKHWMLVNIDQRSRRSIVLHTWQRYQPSEPVVIPSLHHTLTVMTYNLWHNSPPSWVWRYHKERWQKYEDRLE
jgi:hypothetical protein